LSSSERSATSRVFSITLSNKESLNGLMRSASGAPGFHLRRSPLV
jgi:hypothetical protein